MRQLLVSCAVLVTAIAGAAPVSAAPIVLTFTSQIVFADPIPGVSVGDVATVQLIVDNGGTTTSNQQWFDNDLISGSATIGTYSANYVPPFIPGTFFATDATGAVVVNVFGGSDPSHYIVGGNSDIFGVGGFVFLSPMGLTDYEQRLAVFGTYLDVGTWIAAPASAPEPASMLLLGTALAGAGVRRWRQKRA